MKPQSSLKIKSIDEVETGPYKFGHTYFIRLRQHADHFSGLWDLEFLTPSGQVKKTISQADNLNICIENLQGEIENDGF